MGETYFGILHLDRIGINTPYDVPICLHTCYGNLYIVRKNHIELKPKGACSHCIGHPLGCGNSFSNVHCYCVFLRKYEKNNRKVANRFLQDEIDRMVAADSRNPDFVESESVETWTRWHTNVLNIRFSNAV